MAAGVGRDATEVTQILTTTISLYYPLNVMIFKMTICCFRIGMRWGHFDWVVGGGITVAGSGGLVGPTASSPSSASAVQDAVGGRRGCIGCAGVRLCLSRSVAVFRVVYVKQLVHS